MTAQPTPTQVWMLATRPKTLPAAVAPVLVGVALAIRDDAFLILPSLAALLGALFLQIGVNLANDYFDFKAGIDTEERLGPPRAAASGLITPEALRTGMFVVFGLAVLTGIYLIIVGGWPILAIGLASIAAALAYSGGPFPLASNGLGDLFVFIFFGLTAVCGTYFVQAQALPWEVVLAAVAPGTLITAILVVNNLRDIDTDARTGKRTLAVMLGAQGSRMEYILLLAIAYLIPLIMLVLGETSLWSLLPLLSLALAFPLLKTMRDQVTGRALNKTLANTARLALVFCILFAIGLSL